MPTHAHTMGQQTPGLTTANHDSPEVREMPVESVLLLRCDFGLWRQLQWPLLPQVTRHSTLAWQRRVCLVQSSLLGSLLSMATRVGNSPTQE